MRRVFVFLLILFSVVRCAAQQNAFSVQPLTGERVQVVGGTIFTGTTNVTIPNTILALTDGATNYIFITSAGVLSINTSGIGANFPIATVVTLNGIIVSITDNRANVAFGANLASPGPIGGTTPAAGTFTTLTASSLASPAATELSLSSPAGRIRLVDSALAAYTGANRLWQIQGVSGAGDFSLFVGLNGGVGANSLFVSGTDGTLSYRFPAPATSIPICDNTALSLPHGLATCSFLTTTKLAIITTTVGALPAAASNAGAMISVSDSTAIAAEGQTCVGGSTNTALAFSNGTVWKCF